MPKKRLIDDPAGAYQKRNIIIGIDPDSDKSGVAVWDRSQKRLLTYGAFKFFELYLLLKTYKGTYGDDVIVIIESVALLAKKSNWHNNRQGVHVAARIGRNVGACGQTAKHIAEMCEYIGLDYTPALRPPPKLTMKQFEKTFGLKVSNQDVRDAILLVWGR